MGNDSSKVCKDMINTFGDLQIDDATRDIINQYSPSSNTGQMLGFHSICGTNVQILKNGRMAKRKESFCKGLAFSNRPVELGENVCLKLTEVATNWSGVMRFGVTNFNPETYRNTPVPKFACPDLTTKDGYWAKALPERYSVKGNILHFYVNSAGELFYGINGSQKGMFLTGIDTSTPLWLIVDIYGNSVALEFIDTSEFRPRDGQIRRSVPQPLIFRPRTTPSLPPIPSSENTTNSSVRSSSISGINQMRFHAVTGRHITLNGLRNIATRNQDEYMQGYVFTERPIKNNEKVIITINAVEPLYEGGIAFGLTCCDPASLHASELPDDSSDLVEMPDYWVGIKDIALQPRKNSILSFWITDAGEVKFEIGDAGPRTVLHVDNSLQLYMYFDVYGSTLSIKLLGTLNITRTNSPIRPLTAASSENRNEIPLSIPSRPARELIDPSPATSRIPTRPSSSTVALRVNVRNDTNDVGTHAAMASTSSVQRPSVDELLDSTFDLSSVFPPVQARYVRPSLGELTTPIRPAPPRPTSVSTSSFDPTPLRQAQSSSETSRTRESASDDKQEDGDECSICMEARVNAVLYTCGHMCMCYTCAKQLLDSDNNKCPLCRTKIRDVIKCFKA